jgi:hypothetical protein
MKTSLILGLLGSLIAVAAHGATVAPSYTLPPQPPGTGNLAFWIDHKTSSNFVFEDMFRWRSVAMLEDMTGNGNGIGQTNKMQQPLIGPWNGPLFNSNRFLMCVGGDMLAGAQKVTLGFGFTLSSHYGGALPRILFDMSNPGVPSQHQLEIAATGGTGADASKIQVTVQPNGGSQLITSTSGVWQLTSDIKHTLVVEVNLAASPATVNMYVDGLVYGTTYTFTSTQTAFASTASGAIYLGNAFTTPKSNAPLVGEIGGALGYLSIDTAERAAVMTYLGGL